MDPLAEKYPEMTPYNYVGNNPINAIDIRGDSITPIGGNQHLQMGVINWNQGLSAGNGYTLYGGTGTNSSGNTTQMWVASNNTGATPSGSAEFVMNVTDIKEFRDNTGYYKGLSNIINYYSQNAGKSMTEGYIEVMSNPINYVVGASAYAGRFGKLSRVQRNRNVGNSFRDEVATVFENHGRSVSKEVYKSTPFGARFIDLEISNSKGTLLGGVETKVGGSPYTLSQRAKDYYLKTVQNYPVNVIRKKK